MVNSADPDQLASSEANWSGSTLFAKAWYIWVQQDKGQLVNKCMAKAHPGLHGNIVFNLSLHLWSYDRADMFKIILDKRGSQIDFFSNFSLKT